MSGETGANVDRVEWLRTMTTAHEKLASLVEGISDDRLLDQAMGDWTGKDVLAHLAWWQTHSARLSDDFSAKREPDDKTHPGDTTDEINEYVFREHLDDSPEEARHAFTKSFQRLLVAIDLLSDDDLFGSNRAPWLEGGALSVMIFGDTTRHYQQHRADLEQLAASEE